MSESSAGGAAGSGGLADFHARRTAGQQRLLAVESLVVKRLLRLDSMCYEDASGSGGLDEKTKELLGLVASAVLRCDDCISYHIERCVQVGWTKGEVEDALGVSMIVGGTIVIPHARRALVMLDEVGESEKRKAKS